MMLFLSFVFSLSFSLSLCLCLKRSPRLMDPFVSSCLLWAGNSEAALEQHTCRPSSASSPLTTRSTQARLLWCFFLPTVFCDKHHISDRLELAAVIIFYYVKQTQRSHWGLVVLTISVFVGIFFFIKRNTASIKKLVSPRERKTCRSYAKPVSGAVTLQQQYDKNRDDVVRAIMQNTHTQKKSHLIQTIFSCQGNNVFCSTCEVHCFYCHLLTNTSLAIVFC